MPITTIPRKSVNKYGSFKQGGGCEGREGNETKNEVGWKIGGGEVQNGRVDDREGERSQKNGKREEGEGEGFKKKKCVSKVGIGFKNRVFFKN